MRVLVMANGNDSDAALVGDRLRERGSSLELLVREEHATWPEPGRYDAIVSLGSEWSVYWGHVAAPVQAEIAFLRAAHGRGTPTFGICFGSQLLAVAHGGDVHRAPAAEIGWYDVTVAPEGPGVLAGAWFQWHYDRWTPPPAAELLATSPLANQAFRIGRTLAVQFHPEVSYPIIARWVAEGGAAALDALGIDRDGFLADSAARIAEVRPRTDALVDWFLDTVAGSEAPPVGTVAGLATAPSPGVAHGARSHREVLS